MPVNTSPPPDTTAPANGLDCLVYCRMSTADLEEARRLAVQEDRKISAFVRAMYRRGLADFKARRDTAGPSAA